MLLVLLLLIGLGTSARAAQVSLGSIGVFAGLGSSASDQQVLLYNQTGQTDCTTATSFALVCDFVDITDWAVQIEYTALIGSNQVAQTPVTNSSATCSGTGCVTIASGNDPTVSPLYTLPYSAVHSCCDTLVTKITFTGHLQSSFHVWLPGATSSSLFFPQSPFTVEVDIPADDPYSTGDAPGYLVDLLVSDIGGGGGGGGNTVPEPASYLLGAGGALAVIARRRFAR